MTRRRMVLVLALALMFVLGGVVMAAVPWDGNIVWTGQGSDSLRCDKLGESPERTAAGWMHWILTQAKDVTAAELVLGGTGSGTYSPNKYGSVVEFFTPYFNPVGLTAVVNYSGTLDKNSQFVLSDYCPGDQEKLEVSKTAVTYFERTHSWSIAKKVDPTAMWLYIDGSGDGMATWTIDVTYEGYVDSAHKVSGEVTIKNTGQLDAVITSIADVLGGTAINLDCSVTFPYVLPAGQTLTCSYSENGYFEGKNVVTVTTERDAYGAEKALVWGDPDKEINKSVTVKDYSDLFGEVTLGTATAPNNAQFTYSKMFKWADYGADKCGAYAYWNTAKVFGDGGVELGFAKAKLDVYVQCYVYETAYAKGSGAVCFIPTFANWGWTNPLPNPWMELWAGAGRCDTSKGTLVGYTNDWGNISLNAPYILKEYHVYRGKTMFPLDRRGRATVAPGQYYIEAGAQWVIVHAVVGIPDPNFGK